MSIYSQVALFMFIVSLIVLILAIYITHQPKGKGIKHGS
jgi:hypothetical protein